MNLTITEKAVERIKAVLQEKNLPEAMIWLFIADDEVIAGDRVFRVPAYRMAIITAAAINEDDIIIEQHGVKIVVDRGFAQFFDGVAIDYEENESGGRFRISNPNIVRPCSCDHSCQANGCGGCTKSEE